MISLETRLLRSEHAAAARARGRHHRDCAACVRGDLCVTGVQLLSTELETQRQARESALLDASPAPGQAALF